MRPLILIAEDDFGFRDTLEDVLVDEGYPVATARDGSEALAMLDALARPALILLDVQMPVMDGVEFLARLRARPDRESYEVVMMSAADEVRSFEHLPPVVGTIRKPFDLDAILTVVEEFRLRRLSTVAGHREAAGSSRAEAPLRR